MNKNSKLTSWFWKWHIIAGLITLPFMLMLSVSGIIYLFKDNVDSYFYSDIIEAKQDVAIVPISYTAQLEAAKRESLKPVVAVTIPTDASQATKFKVAGRGRASNSLYVDPYSNEVTGQVNQKQTLMYDVRKFHGELLLGRTGTLVVELVASWFIVLILTGLYIWWPKKSSGAAGFFTIRTKNGSRTFWRDIHAVTGFWLSSAMLVILAGGMPWTDMFGTSLKWVQQQTETGYPSNWRDSKGLESSALASNGSLTSLNLDEVVSIASQSELAGEISIVFPQGNKGVYRISNRSLFLKDQQVLHIDQFSGEVIKRLNWADVGLLMDLRQVFMRLHQGEYGLVNWIVLLMVAVLFTLTIVGAIVSYLKRKPKGNWGIPKVPARFQVDKILLFGIVILGIVFPMFGASLVAIWLWDKRHLFRFAQRAA